MWKGRGRGDETRDRRLCPRRLALVGSSDTHDRLDGFATLDLGEEAEADVAAKRAEDAGVGRKRGRGGGKG